MAINLITQSAVIFSGSTLNGKPVQKLTRTIGDLKGLFADQSAFEEQDTNQIAYEVESYFPVPEGRGWIACLYTYLPIVNKTRLEHS